MTKQNKDDAPGSGDVKTDKATPKSLGLDESQALMDEETEKGYRGTKVDTTDDHAYTVEGVINNEPTPETDPGLAKEQGSTKFAHVNEPKKGKK